MDISKLKLFFITLFFFYAIAYGNLPVITVNSGESVQEAINAASNGDTILINAGRYGVSLNINKNLTFLGGDSNKDNVILYATSVSWIIGYVPNDTVFFKNLTIAGYRNVYADSNSVVTYDSVHLIPRYFGSNPYVDTYRNIRLLKNAKMYVTNTVCDTVGSYYAINYSGVENHLTATIEGNSIFSWSGNSVPMHLVSVRDSAKFLVRADSLYSSVNYEYSYLTFGVEDTLNTSNPNDDANYLAKIAQHKPTVDIDVQLLSGFDKIYFFNGTQANLKVDSTHVQMRVLGSAYLRVDSSTFDRIDGWHNGRLEVYNSRSIHDIDEGEFGSHNLEFSLDNSSYTKFTFTMYNSDVIYTGDSGRYHDKGNPLAFYDVNVYMENCRIYRYANTWVLGSGGGIAGENAYPDILSVTEGDSGSQNTFEIRDCLFENVGEDSGPNATNGLSLASLVNTPLKVKIYNSTFRNSHLAVMMNTAARTTYTDADTLLLINCSFEGKRIQFGFDTLDIFNSGYSQFYNAYAQALKRPIAYADHDTIVFTKNPSDTIVTVRYLGQPSFTYSMEGIEQSSWLSASNDAVNPTNKITYLTVSVSRNLYRSARVDTLLLPSNVTQDTIVLYIHQEAETDIIHDGKIIEGYAKGKKPLIYGDEDTVKVVVGNFGNDTLTNLPVRRNRTGTNPYSDSVMIASIIPGEQITVTFPVFNPTLVGVDTVTISIPDDSVAEGNQYQYIQAVTSDTYNYADTTQPVNASARFSNNTQYLLVRFRMNNSGYVNFVRSYVPSSEALVGKSLYGVVLDSAGNKLSQSADSIIALSDLGKYKEFVLQTPPVISNSDFFVGVGGRGTFTNIDVVGVQEETPVRQNAYYRVDSLNTTELVTDTVTGRFVIEGVVGPVPLPVEMTSFTAQNTSGLIRLVWNTATEENFNGFLIQRKPVNSSTEKEWKELGFVRGAGNSFSPKEYSFTDKLTKPGDYLYRLKIIDNDGSYTYSAVISAQLLTPSTFVLHQNYPNPFNPLTNIRFELPANAQIRIEVINILGQVVAVPVHKEYQAGTYMEIFDAGKAGLSSGIYFYRMTATNSQKTPLFTSIRKMVILK